MTSNSEHFGFTQFPFVLNLRLSFENSHSETFIWRLSFGGFQLEPPIRRIPEATTSLPVSSLVRQHSTLSVGHWMIQSSRTVRLIKTFHLRAQALKANRPHPPAGKFAANLTTSTQVPRVSLTS